jgi:hypothetical protein
MDRINERINSASLRTNEPKVVSKNHLGVDSTEITFYFIQFLGGPYRRLCGAIEPDIQ